VFLILPSVFDTENHQKTFTRTDQIVQHVQRSLFAYLYPG